MKPSVPVLNEAVFYPAYWRKEPQKSSLSHVSLYFSSRSKKMLLQAELFKNRLPFGVLCLIGEEGIFEPSDYILLNYASILCTGIDDYKRRSRRIEAAIEMICGGQMPDSSVTNLFPESGYALVLRDLEADGTADGKKGVFVLSDPSLFSAEALLQLFGGRESAAVCIDGRRGPFWPSSAGYFRPCRQTVQGGSEPVLHHFPGGYRFL